MGGGYIRWMGVLQIRGFHGTFSDTHCRILNERLTWVVVKIIVPFWIPIKVRHLIFRVPKRDHTFDNYTHDPLIVPWKARFRA